MIAFTKSLGKELADTNIRVNAVAPAAVETDILQQMAPEYVQAMIAIVIAAARRSWEYREIELGGNAHDRSVLSLHGL